MQESMRGAEHKTLLGKKLATYSNMQECMRGVRSTRGDWGARIGNSEGPLGCLGIRLHYCLKTRRIYCFMDRKAEYLIAI